MGMLFHCNRYRSFSLTSRSLRRNMSFTQIRRSRPANWKAAAQEPIPGTLTFAAQTKLPKLSVPVLQDTLVRLKDSVKSIAWSEEEYTTVLKKINDFADNQGPILQSRLLERASQLPHWLEEWWDDTGYLGYRESVRAVIPFQFGSLMSMT